MACASAPWTSGRPDYASPEPAYLYRKPEDFRHCLAFVHAQIRELLTQYGAVNGLWLDPIMGYDAQPDLFPIAETYALIRKLQPQCLICFKQGANGDEDFVAPERTLAAQRTGGEVGRRGWELNKNKLPEICDTLQPGVWGYRKAEDSLNTGPLPDGSIHPEDVPTLEEVGRRLRGRKIGG